MRKVQLERKFRSETAHFDAWHMLEISTLHRGALMNRYVSFSSSWQNYEVQQGFWAELGSVYTYFCFHFFNPDSGVWMVFFSEWCMWVAVTLIWDVHDMRRLWYRPPALISAMKQLDYSSPLGWKKDNLDVQALLGKIKSVNWDEFPLINVSFDMYNYFPSLSPGRFHQSAGDYVRIKSASGELCSKEEASLGRVPSGDRSRLLATKSLT